jgi:hypothetical protein
LGRARTVYRPVTLAVARFRRRCARPRIDVDGVGKTRFVQASAAEPERRHSRADETMVVGRPQSRRGTTIVITPDG